MSQRKLQSLGGSFNELDEIQLILSNRKKDEYQELVNRYGGDWANEFKANRKETSKEDSSDLKTQFKEDQTHNARYLAETQRQLEEQNNGGATV